MSKLNAHVGATHPNYQSIIECAGGEVVGIQDGLVYFHDLSAPKPWSTMALHTKDLDASDDAVKMVREYMAEKLKAFKVADIDRANQETIHRYDPANDERSTED